MRWARLGCMVCWCSATENAAGGWAVRLIFEQIRTGGDRNVAYLVGDREAVVAVDPSLDLDAVLARAEAQSLEVTHAINPHGHHDHTNGNRVMRSRGARIVAHGVARTPPDVAVGDGERMAVGGWALRFLHTPGAHAGSDLDGLLRLKAEWPGFKRRHGLK